MKKLLILVAFVAMFMPVSTRAASAGDLIKLTDDGDPATQHDSAVYYVGDDGKRYVFPNANTYFTWYADFSTVKAVSDAEMASHSIGGNVTYRPGTRMVKIQSDPKVYAVEPGGVLRGIGSEAVASALYGNDWNTKIDDVADTYFINYTVGASLEAAIYPSGSFVRRPDGGIFYIDGGAKRAVPSMDVLSSLRVQDPHILVSDDDLSTYPDGSAVAAGESALIDTSGKNLVSVAAVPTFSVVTPASTFIGVGTDATLLDLTYSAAQATLITKITVRIDSTTDDTTDEPDDDESGLVYGNNAQANLRQLRFIDGNGAQPFGSKELLLDVNSDESQTLQFTGNWNVPASTPVTLKLKAQINTLLPNAKGYRVTLLPSGTTVLINGTPTAFVPQTNTSGPTLTTLSDTLKVELDGALGGKTVVRGTSRAEVTGFKLKATSAVPNVVKSLTFQGYIDEQEGGGGFLPGTDADNGTPTTVQAMMSSAWLYDEGGTVLGGPVPVDIDGRVIFNGLDISIPAGGTKQVVIRGDITATIDLETAANRLSFDMMNALTDAVVTDVTGSPVLASGKNPNGGNVPTRFLTVRKTGTIDLAYSGTSGKVIAGTTATLGTASIETEYDAYVLQNISFVRASGAPASLGDLTLTYPVEGGTASATAPLIGNIVTFNGINAVIARDVSSQLVLKGVVKQKDGGAVYDEDIGMNIATSGPFTFVSTADGEVYDAQKFTGGDFAISENTTGVRKVRWSDVTAALGTTQASVYKDSAAEVFRFSMSANAAGAIRVRKMTFKFSPNDAGNAGADALEGWADTNGDFIEDDDIINIRRVVGSGTDEPIAEGSSGHIRYTIFSGNTAVPSSEDHTSVSGDYAKLEVEFNEGSEYSISAGTTVTFVVQLLTSVVADGATRRITAEMLSGADFTFTDIPFGAYAPLSGGDSGGVGFSHTFDVID